jgi:hypothetical protein
VADWADALPPGREIIDARPTDDIAVLMART